MQPIVFGGHGNPTTPKRFQASSDVRQLMAPRISGECWPGAAFDNLLNVCSKRTLNLRIADPAIRTTSATERSPAHEVAPVWLAAMEKHHHPVTKWAA